MSLEALEVLSSVWPHHCNMHWACIVVFQWVLYNLINKRATKALSSYQAKLVTCVDLSSHMLCRPVTGTRLLLFSAKLLRMLHSASKADSKISMESQNAQTNMPGPTRTLAWEFHTKYNLTYLPGFLPNQIILRSFQGKEAKQVSIMQVKLLGAMVGQGLAYP